MTTPPRSYRALTRSLRTLLPVVATVAPSIQRALSDRRESARHFADWAAGARDRRRSLLLCHAASAGELRQLEPVLHRLRRRHPQWQLALTWTSPSAETIGSRLPADVAGFIPWDLPEDVESFLDALSPSALVVSKLDLWPELILAAARRQIPLGLIAGTVRAQSGRLRWPARGMLQATYHALDLVGAVGAADAERLIRLGARTERISLLGDPRADAVLERIHQVNPAAEWPQLAGGGPLLVAGSTWPVDEDLLLAAFLPIRQAIPGARLLLAPHQPTPHHLQRLSARARALALPAPVPVAAASATDPLLLLDQIGPLARLYGMGLVAYVGGGFGRAGLHSVLEPAAWGRPVIVGPNWAEQRDATLLYAAGALRPLPRAAAERALVQCWGSWLGGEAEQRAAGEAARRVVELEAGAADRCAELVERLLLR